MSKNIIEETNKIDIECYEFEKLTNNIETKFKLLKMYIEPVLEYLEKMMDGIIILKFNSTIRNIHFYKKCMQVSNVQNLTNFHNIAGEYIL